MVPNLTDLAAMMLPALIITLSAVPRPLLHIGLLIASALPISSMIGLGLGEGCRRRQGDADGCDGGN
jgi:hypothetical protein